jgi:tetratricopeptide (TPR) repeat protein
VVEYRLAVTATFNPVEALKEIVKRFPEADQAVAALPVDHIAPRRLARILVDEDRSDVAVRYLKRVVEEKPPDVDTLKLLADIAGRTRDQPAAELALTRLSVIEQDQDTYVALARVLNDQKKYADAEKAARRAIQKRGPFLVTVQAHVLLVDILIGAAHWGPARDELMKMREDPELYIAARKDIHTRLAVVEDALGHPHEAELERQRAKGP